MAIRKLTDDICINVLNEWIIGRISGFLSENIQNNQDKNDRYISYISVVLNINFLYKT